MLKPFPQCARAHVLDTHAKYALVTARLGREHIFVSVNEISAWGCEWVLTNLGIRESTVCTRPRYDFTQEDTTEPTRL